jgi:predicted RecA/RadA family phage recombinase
MIISEYKITYLLVRRGSTQLSSGDAYILGETLTVTMTDTGNQVRFPD